MSASPPHSVTDTYGSRYYQWADNRYWSVTTIIDALEKPGLRRWAQKAVAERAMTWYEDGSFANLESQGISRDDALKLLADAPNDIRDDSATAGREVHKWVEEWIAWVSSQDVDHPRVPTESMSIQPEKVASWIDQWNLFLNEYDPTFTHSEVKVFNRSRAYAGTLDAICEINGETWIIDIKTGRNLYGTHALQLAAYANAEFIGGEDGYAEHPMPKIDRAAILHLRPRSHKLVEVDISSEVFNYFLYCQQAFMFKQVKEADVLMDVVPFIGEVADA